MAVYCRLPLFLKGDVGLPEGSLEDILAGDSPETDKTLVGLGTEESLAGEKRGGHTRSREALNAVRRMFRYVCVFVCV